MGIPVNLYGTMEPFEASALRGLLRLEGRPAPELGGTEDPFKPGWSVYSEYLQSELVKTAARRDST